MKFIKLLVRILFALAMLPSRIVFILVSLGVLIEAWACDDENQKQDAKETLVEMLCKLKPYN